MQDSFDQVRAAFQSFLARRDNDQASGDIVSVVTFNESAQIQLQYVSISDARKANISYRGGGTTFTPAIQACDALIGSYRGNGYKPVMLFMTDGGAEDASDVLKQTRQKYAARGFDCWIVAFGSMNPSILNSLASAAGTTVQHCRDGQDLANLFVKISSDCTVHPGLHLSFTLFASRFQFGCPFLFYILQLLCFRSDQDVRISNLIGSCQQNLHRSSLDRKTRDIQAAIPN
jgi:uncharacterized protein YegL